MPDPPTWDYEALARAGASGHRRNQRRSSRKCSSRRFSREWSTTSRAPAFGLDDELWVRIVYAFAAATRRGSTGIEHLAGMFVPLYLWRAAAFMAQTAREDAGAVQARLDSLCETFQRLKPVLVGSWSAEV